MVTLPTPEPKKSERLTVPIDAELKDGLEKIARATGLSMAEVTRRWLAYAVESNRAREEVTP